VDTRATRTVRRPFGLLMQKPVNAGNQPSDGGCAPAIKRRAVQTKTVAKSTGLKLR
jgi:hypothetical protein